MANETIADIIAEMRIFKCRNLETGELELCNAIANYFADRLDAAHRRERGNVAKLRESVGYILKYADSVACRDHDEHTRHYIDQIRKWAQSALAAPARNCDVGTLEEQSKRKIKFCHNQGGCVHCSFSKSATLTHCALAWAQMPYKEGENK